MRIKYIGILITIFFITTLLASCGYQLRGYNTTKLNLHSLYINTSDISSSDINNRFLHHLTNTLRTQEVDVKTSLQDSKQPDYILTLTGANFNKNIISTASSKLITQFKMSFIIYFNFSKAQSDKNILSNQIINVSRNYNYTQDQILGLADEEEFLIEEMISEATSRIIMQLNLTTR